MYFADKNSPICTAATRPCVCFQNIVLPKLPVPILEQTLERYLETVKPIVNDAQYERTRAMVKAFGSSNGPGPRLQEKLLQLREEKDNWVSRWKQYDMEKFIDRTSCW